MAYTPQEIKQFVESRGIADNPYAMANYAKQYGVSAGQVDQAMGYQPGTSQNWLDRNLWSGNARQSNPATDADVARTVGGGIGIKDATQNPHQAYAVAQANRWSPEQTDRAFGLGAGTSSNWAQQQGLNWGHGQNMTQQYQQNPTSNPYIPMAGGQQMPQQMPQQRPQGFSQNPYLGQMADDISRRSANFLNRQVMPAINRGAVANGTYGSSRQGIAQGLAASGAADALQGNLANLFGGQFNADRNYGLQSDALDLNVYNANQNWMRQGQQDQLGLYDRLLGWNQQYGIGNATNIRNTPLNYWQQFVNGANSIAGQGGTQTQNMQGNPYLGAIGGFMAGQSLYNNWNRG